MILYGTHLGLGEDDSGSDQFSVNIPSITLTAPTLPAAYSDTDTLTGLPVYLEIGLGAVALWLLVRGTQTDTRRVRAGVKAARRRS